MSTLLIIGIVAIVLGVSTAFFLIRTRVIKSESFLASHQKIKDFISNNFDNCREINLTFSIIERKYGISDEKYSRFLVKVIAEYEGTINEYWLKNFGCRVHVSEFAECITETQAQEEIKKFLVYREKKIKEKERNTLTSEETIKTISATIPATPEALVKYVNEMSDSDYENFSTLLEQSGRHPIRKREEVLLLK